MKRLTTLCVLCAVLAGINLAVQWQRYVDGVENRGRYYGIVMKTAWPDGPTQSYCVVLAKSLDEAERVLWLGDCNKRTEHGVRITNFSSVLEKDGFTLVPVSDKVGQCETRVLREGR